MRIVFAGGGTGGHLYPAMAIARAVVARDASVRPLFVGAQRGIEREILPGTEFEHVLLDLHPLYRARPWENWRTLAGLVSAWRALGRLYRYERPAVVVGTGGYASGAALGRAVQMRIPIALQEQNSHPGMTTRVFSRWAREVWLGYGEAAARLHAPSGAWVGETGNPITPPPDPLPNRAAARAKWGFPERGGLVLLIFGGSQGARALNEVVGAWIERGVPDRTYVIWGTGRASHEGYAHLESECVRVLPYLAPIADAYAAADLALTRAGALTVAELCAWGIPSILVPLPTAAADHQTANAKVLAAAGTAVMVRQTELTVARLGAEIAALVHSPELLAERAKAALARARPQAAAHIAERLMELARNSSRRTR